LNSDIFVKNHKKIKSQYAYLNIFLNILIQGFLQDIPNTSLANQNLQKNGLKVLKKDFFCQNFGLTQCKILKFFICSAIEFLSVPKTSA
jgi:hypothetical protein